MDILELIWHFIEFIANLFGAADLVNERSVLGKIIIAVILLGIIVLIVWLIVRFIVVVT